jgi:putative transposase
MRLIDELFTEHPFYGRRRITAALCRQGTIVNHKHVARLMRAMGLEAIYPKPRTSTPDKQHEKFPYLLRGLRIDRPNQVWATDITYIRLRAGFVYLMAIIDWFSRYVIDWQLSTTLDDSFCVEALDRALSYAKPEIFNSDQGVQFTSKDFTSLLKNANVAISMDGIGRALDNIFVERLWRSLKYEEVYTHDYENPQMARQGISRYLRFFNHERPHQSLAYNTPAEVYFCRLTRPMDFLS